MQKGEAILLGLAFLVETIRGLWQQSFQGRYGSVERGREPRAVGLDLVGPLERGGLLDCKGEV